VFLRDEETTENPKVVIMEGSSSTGMQFIVKNLVAEEMEIATGKGMTRLSELREHVRRRWRIPDFPQVCTVGGRQCDDSEDHLLKRMMDRQVGGEGHLKIVWLCWMGDDGFHLVHDGGMCLENELEQKQEHANQQGKPFEAIALRTWRTLSLRATHRFKQCHRLAPEDHSQ
jgi:hypothetical protein